LRLVHRVVDRGAVVVAHLGPAGNARLDAVPHGIERNFLGQLVDEEGTLRPRADHAHVALEHAIELRQFIDAGLADKAAYARYPLIVAHGPARLAVTLRVTAHAAELDDIE